MSDIRKETATAYPSADALTGSETVMVVQDGHTKKTTTNVLGVKKNGTAYNVYLDVTDCRVGTNHVLTVWGNFVGKTPTVTTANLYRADGTYNFDDVSSSVSFSSGSANEIGAMFLLADSSNTYKGRTLNLKFTLS